MASVFDYIFNIGGNFTAQINGMSAAAGDFSAKAEVAESRGRSFAASLATFSYLKDVAQNVTDGISQLTGAGTKLDSQMHDLSAVAGVTGDSLKQIEGFARESAKTFGTDASVAVEGYKLLLSQLSPELGKYPDALREMGDCIQTTSKLMGNDGAAAAEVLTTAMNQFGVSMEDPTAAAATMAEMMNTMAAAGQAGSAELPSIAAALNQCGMAAKAAGVSFEETNAAIQVLDKSGKKASEGGVALRNVLGQLSKGRFIEKQAADELKAAGIDVVALGDSSKSLKERLEMLKPMLNDSALLSKFFGVENANAARALIQGTDALGDFTEKVTGTTSATDQAAIVMDSYAERQARVNQKIEDFKITLFQATGDFSLWVGTIGTALVPLAQLCPLIMGVGNLMLWVKNLNWASMWNWIRGAVYTSRIQMALMNRELVTGQFVSNGFFINITRATLAVVRFATVGIFNALKGLGALVLSFVTTGTASATFSGIASASFGAFATSARVACRAVSVAIMNIPVVGWVIAGITALVAIGVYIWNTSVKFRAVIKGLWAGFKAFFTGLKDLASKVFSAIGDLILACFKFDGQGISNALGKLKNAYSTYGSEIGKAFNEAYQAELKAGGEKDAAAEGKKASGAVAKAVPSVNSGGGAVGAPVGGTPKVDPVGGSLKSAGGSSAAASAGGDGGKIKNITINIEKLVEKLELHTTTLTEGTEQIRERVFEALMGALNDTQIATE